MSHVNKFISLFASIQSNAMQVCGCHPQPDPTGWRLCQWGGNVVPFFRSWWSIVRSHSLALSNPFYHFNLCIYDRTNFLLFLLHLDSLSTTISIYPINHAFHIQNTVHLISYQVWYRVIQIVINRDDVQVHFRNVHVLWYEYKVKFVPDMWLGCFHSHRKFTHQK